MLAKEKNKAVQLKLRASLKTGESKPHLGRKPKSTPKEARLRSQMQQKPASVSALSAPAHFSCGCSICVTQMQPSPFLAPAPALPYLGAPLSLPALLLLLCPLTPSLKGCQTQLPDTVFLKEGRPLFIARTDREGCLQKQDQPSRLALSDIRQRFAQVARDRTREGVSSPNEEQGGRDRLSQDDSSDTRHRD